MNCPFCNSNEIIASNSQAYALYDRHPVNPGHILIVTKRHVEDFFDTTIKEKEAINELIQECKTRLDHEYSPDGL